MHKIPFMKYICLIPAIILWLHTSAHNKMYDDSIKAASNHQLALQLSDKARQQKKTRNILLISGATLVVVGLVTAVAGYEHGPTGVEVGGVMAFSGTVLMVTAIPFTFMSRHNEKEAKLLLQTNEISMSSLQMRKIYSVGIAVNF
jgi:hypothetical protein